MATNESETTGQLTIETGFKQLVADANRAVTTYPVAEAIDRLDDDDVVFVDVRDEPELDHNGKIPGAVHASRGMLEFHVDPDSPYHLDEFAPGKEFLLYCAVGGRSTLSAKRIQEMGLESVAHIEGGFDAWTDAGGPVERRASVSGDGKA